MATRKAKDASTSATELTTGASPTPAVPSANFQAPAIDGAGASGRSIVALHVNAYQRLNVVDLGALPPAGVIEIRGRNGEGKTSLVDSMLETLGAHRSAMPINSAAHTADVSIDLGDLRVSKRWSRDSAGDAKAALTVEASGIKLGSPNAVLERLRGKFADPVAFLGMPAAEQAAVVIGILGLDESLKRLETVADSHYTSRRDLGRDADRAEKSAEALASALVGLPLPSECEPLLSLEELTAELERRKDHNAGVQRLRAEVQTIEREGNRAKVDIEQATERLRAAERAAADAKASIERLTAERAQLVEKWSARNDDLRGMDGHELDLQEITSAITEHGERSRIQAKFDFAGEAKAAAERARAAHAAVEQQLEDARAAISDLLTQAPFPVHGMGYDVEKRTLTIDGIPFGQASQAQRLSAAATIAMAGNPSIRVLFARDGSLLDSASRAALSAQAEAAGFQLWLEIVDDNPNGPGIWIEDGFAVQASEK